MTREHRGWSLGGITFGLRQAGKTPESSVLNHLEPRKQQDVSASIREAEPEVSLTTTKGEIVVLERATVQF